MQAMPVSALKATDPLLEIIIEYFIIVHAYKYDYYVLKLVQHSKLYFQVMLLTKNCQIIYCHCKKIFSTLSNQNQKKGEYVLNVI